MATCPVINTVTCRSKQHGETSQPLSPSALWGRAGRRPGRCAGRCDNPNAVDFETLFPYPPPRQKGSHGLVPLGVPMTDAPRQESLPLDPNDNRFSVALPGAYPCVNISLTPGAVGVKASTGSMLTMHPQMSLRANMEGGCCNGCALLCIGESCCLSHFSVKPGASHADALLAPELIGDLAFIEVRPDVEIKLQPGAFLASDATVDLSAGFLGIAGCCAMGTCCTTKAKGYGKLFFNGFGSVARYDLGPGEERKFDNTYVIGWTYHPDLKYKLCLAGDSIAGSVCSGEGLAIKFTNHSPTVQSIFVQTRSLKQFALRLAKYLPTASSAGNGGGGGGGGE